MPKNSAQSDDTASQEQAPKTAPELASELPDYSQDQDELPEMDESSADATQPKPAHTAADAAAINAQQVSDGAPSAEAAAIKPDSGFFKRLGSWIHRHNKITVPAAVLILLSILAAVPYTRYALAGTFLTQQYAVTVVDSETKKPVTSAIVKIGTQQSVTDNNGKASVRVAVGKATVAVSKKYYESGSQQVTVPIFKQKNVPQIRLRATGRQVSVTVVNKITQKPLANAAINAAGAEAKTDSKGVAVLVVPAGSEVAKATITADGYNQATHDVTVMAKDAAANAFSLTPSGRVYFLSNQSGTMDVVKANLDGTDRQVVLAGTGKEDRNDTTLIASADWRYLALIARRDSDLPKLYLIDTKTDQLTTIDEGDAYFAVSGWIGHGLAYQVSRNNMPYYDAKSTAIKTYNAETKKITLIDENEADEYYDSPPFLLDGKLVFIQKWRQSAPNDKQHAIVRVDIDGKNRTTIKSYPQYDGSGNFYSLSIRRHGPDSFYIMYDSYGLPDQAQFEEYNAGQVKHTTSITTDNQLWSLPTITYLASPSGNKLLWGEDRDGKQALIIGNSNGDNSAQVGAFEKVGTFGWYSDDYILLSKEGNQLFIAPADTLSSESALVKIADYSPTTIYLTN